MTALNKMDLNINERTLGYAKIYASLIQEEFQRKRAYVSIVGLFALVDALEKTGNDIQKNMTIFRNPKLNEKYEIADFYVNNWHIDVRIITEGNNVLLPKIHFDNDIIPDFYAVIKLDKDLKKAELIGFADTVNIEKQAFDYHYYSLPLDTLISFEDFLLKVNKPKITSFDETEHEKFKSIYLSIIDEEINAQDENRILKHLFECEECRREFCCFTGFEMVNSNLGKFPQLFEDKTLNIIGAQAADEEKYQGKEETIDLNEREEMQNKELSQESNPEEEKQDDSDDILDELFSEDVPEPQNVEDETEELNNTQSNGNLEIIQDEISETVQQNSIKEVDDFMEHESAPDLKVIGDTMVDLPSIGGELTLINDEPEQLITEENNSSDLEIISDDNSAEEQNPIENNNDKSDVQKVIVDYDEYGEPVYSYITNVPPEDEKTEDFEAELSDEDILNEEFETYNPVNNIDEDLTNINNGGARTVEYVQSEDDIKEYNNDSPVDEEIVESPEDNYNYEKDIELEDYTETDNSQVVYNDLSSQTYEEEDEEVEQNNENEKMPQEEIVNYQDYEETQEPQEYSEEDENNEDEFEEYDDDSDDETEVDLNQPKKNLALPGIIFGIVILSALIGGFFIFKKGAQEPQIAQNNETVQVEQPQNNDMFETPENNGNPIPENQDNSQMPMDNGNTMPENQPMSPNPEPMIPNPPPVDSPQLTENNLIQPQNPVTADSNRAMTNAFNNGAPSLSLRSLNWMCTPQLFTDNQFKSYLQNLDNLLKLNVRKNILNATDNPQNPNVSVKMAVDNDGNLIKAVIADSSGSEQIDNIVLQSINETFQGEKSPILTDSPLKSDKYYLKVIIKL